MIRTGQSKYALVIGAEVLTQYVDYTDRKPASCLATGPARRSSDQSTEIAEFSRRESGRTDGIEEQLYSPGGGTRRPTTAETLAAGDHFFKMKGNELFKVAVRSMADISREVLEEAGLSART